MTRWRGRPDAAGVLGLVLLACVPGSAHATAAVAAQTPSPAGTASVPADSHLHAAQRQSRGQPALASLVRRACAPAASPGTAALAVQALAQVEAGHRAERALQRPQADRLLQAVVLRGCAAYHATRLQPGTSYPVWWHTRLSIVSVRDSTTGTQVQARASTVSGAVTSSRTSFARGLHHACFAPTDAAGQAACTMVDTHPHGSENDDVGAEAHEGPIIATFAGSVSPIRVELPAVTFRDLPVLANTKTGTGNLGHPTHHHQSTGGTAPTRQP